MQSYQKCGEFSSFEKRAEQVIDQAQYAGTANCERMYTKDTHKVLWLTEPIVLQYITIECPFGSGGGSLYVYMKNMLHNSYWCINHHI